MGTNKQNAQHAPDHPDECACGKRCLLLRLNFQKFRIFYAKKFTGGQWHDRRLFYLISVPVNAILILGYPILPVPGFVAALPSMKSKGNCFDGLLARFTNPLKRLQKEARKSGAHEHSSPQALTTPQPFRVNNKIDWIHAAAVFAAALVIRLLSFYLNLRNNPAFDFPIMDSLYHHEWAKAIISGNFWGTEVFFRGPLYPYFLALLYKVSGTSIAFAILCQHIIGSLTCMLIFMLASEYYARRVSLLAGFISSLYWPFIYFEGELLIVTTALFLNTLFLLLLSRSRRTQHSRLLAAAGLVLGLSAVARPSIVIVIPAVFVFFYLLRDKSTTQAHTRWLGRSAFVTLFCFLVVLPVLIRNYVVGRAVVPIASSAGVNFYIGNNPASDGRTAIVPGTVAPWWGGNEEAIAIAERAVGRDLSPAQASNYYFMQGVKFITSQPARASRLLTDKARMFWTSEERSNDKFIYFFWHLSGMGKIPLPGFWIIAPFALMGLAVQWRRRREISLLYLFIVLYMLGVVAFFVNARFRLPIVPLLIVFASFFIHHLIVAFPKNKKLFACLLLPTLFFLLAVNYDFFTIRKSRHNHLAISHYTLGSAFVQKNEKDKAIGQYELAYRFYKEHPTPSYELIAREVASKLGALYWEKGECLKTIRLLERIRGEDEQSFASMNLLGNCYFKTGQFNNAVRVFAEMLNMRPAYMPALSGLVQTLAARGDFDTALQVLNHAREYFPANDPRIRDMVTEVEKMKANSE